MKNHKNIKILVEKRIQIEKTVKGKRKEYVKEKEKEKKAIEKKKNKDIQLKKNLQEMIITIKNSKKILKMNNFNLYKIT